MTDRTRTVAWQDPTIGAAAMTTMPGLDYLRAMAAGELPPPPITALMNMAIASVEEGEVVFTATPDESHYNPIGMVHGGFACTVLDSALGCAVQSTLAQGFGYTSLEIKVSYLKALSSASGELTCTGRVVKPGKRAAFAEAELRDASGALIATASSTLLVFPLQG
jgi:uncharacterized protein (TIGR00369 family)